MESGQIPDLSIVASSRYTAFNGPERGRLNLPQNGNAEVDKQLSPVIVVSNSFDAKDNGPLRRCHAKLRFLVLFIKTKIHLHEYIHSTEFS